MKHHQDSFKTEIIKKTVSDFYKNLSLLEYIFWFNNLIFIKYTAKK